MTSSPALSGGEGAAAQQVQKFANITGHHFFSYTYNSICLNFIFFLTSYFLLLTSYFLLPTSYFLPLLSIPTSSPLFSAQ
jgi:hypothetical protein